MWVDPIVEEIRAIRRQLAEEAGNDLHVICERLREWEREHPERMAKGPLAAPPEPSAPRKRRPRVRRTANRKPSNLA